MPTVNWLPTQVRADESLLEFCCVYGERFPVYQLMEVVLSPAEREQVLHTMHSAFSLAGIPFPRQARIRIDTVINPEGWWLIEINPGMVAGLGFLYACLKAYNQDGEIGRLERALRGIFSEKQPAYVFDRKAEVAPHEAEILSTFLGGNSFLLEDRQWVGLEASHRIWRTNEELDQYTDVWPSDSFNPPGIEVAGDKGLLPRIESPLTIHGYTIHLKAGERAPVGFIAKTPSGYGGGGVFIDEPVAQDGDYLIQKKIELPVRELGGAPRKWGLDVYVIFDDPKPPEFFVFGRSCCSNQTKLNICSGGGFIPGILL